jgi:SAM-dependent methyltransferase
MMPGRTEDDAVTSQLWGRKARERGESDEWCFRYWQAHPVTLRHINRLMTGDPNEGWLPFIKRRFLPNGGERGLSLGCGHGWTERDAVQLGLCRSFDALDLSEEALDVARREARAAGFDDVIAYRQADLNGVELKSDAYDFVVAAQALHHVEALEHLLDQVANSLRADGLFAVQEYIGPARFQWLDKTQVLMNRILELVPAELKVNPLNGFVKDRIERADPNEIARADPSESIRSDEIVATMEARFDVLYRADFGGTINQFLLADIAANFHEDDVKDVALLDLISLLEEVLVAERVIPSDFAFFVVRPR